MKIKERRIITTWLYSGLLLVGLMVVIGGITRLTNSGLSMVEWKLIGGIIPPLNNLQWEETFEKYKQFPEFQKINTEMKIDEFKLIFFWEYIHRLLGRLIGVIFIVPFIYFWSKKWLENKQKIQLLTLLFLGGIQGLMGWLMVKSGLIDIPAVSHYRLAIHLVLAFGIMCYIYWLILNINNKEKKPNKLINKLSRWIILLLIVQVVYGAFMAGLKAGYILPKNGSFLEKIFGYSLINTNDLSLLSNSINIQAFHRLFAWGIFLVILIVFKKTRKTALENLGIFILLLTIIQIILGVLTLLSRVQLHLAVSHQLIAIILIISIVHLNYISSEKSQ